jgi:hypothetical protein
MSGAGRTAQGGCNLVLLLPADSLHRLRLLHGGFGEVRRWVSYNDDDARVGLFLSPDGCMGRDLILDRRWFTSGRTRSMGEGLIQPETSWPGWQVQRSTG